MQTKLALYKETSQEKLKLLRANSVGIILPSSRSQTKTKPPMAGSTQMSTWRDFFRIHNRLYEYWNQQAPLSLVSRQKY